MSKTRARSGPVVRVTTAVVGRLLEAGELGEPLPPERELAQWLGVSRLTLRWAMDRLAAAGRLRREQGRGAWAAARPRTLPLEHLHTMDMPVLALAVGDPRQATAGWPWRVWLRLLPLARAAGLRPVVVRAAELAGCHAVPPTLRGAVLLGDRLKETCVAPWCDPALDAPAPPAVVLGRRRERWFWNVIDVDWSVAVDEALDAASPTQEDHVLVLFDANAGSLDARRWFESLLNGLARRGVDAQRINVIAGGANESGAYLAARRHLREGGRPTQVFADADLAAAGALRALRRSGLDVSAVRLMGRGGTRVAQYLRPRLTTLTPPIDALARLVIDRVAAGRARRHALSLLPARCQRRASTQRRVTAG